MPNVAVIPFIKSHSTNIFRQLNLPDNYLSQDQLDFMENKGMAFTAIELIPEIRPILLGFAGIIPLWDGVGEAYTFFLPYFKKTYPFFMHRCVKNQIQNIQKKYSFHRLQLGVEQNDNIAYNWALSLGFQYEGTMRNFTPDKRTILLFSKLW